MSQSSWKDQIKKKWGPHNQCPVCGKAMPTDKKYCSQSCKDSLAERDRKQKKKGRFQCIILIVMMVGMIAFLILPGLFV